MFKMVQHQTVLLIPSHEKHFYTTIVIMTLQTGSEKTANCVHQIEL